MSDINELKRRIRKEMRERRRALGEALQREHALAVRDNAARMDVLRDSLNVACYWAVDGELDLSPLIELCRGLDKDVYMPVVLEQGSLAFRLYRQGDPLPRNRFGIPEPMADATAIEPGMLDIVFAPLVAFSPGGNRLGMGGGYYDRTFQGRARPGRLIGVAHSCQRYETLPTDNRDVAVDEVLTELGLIS